MFIRPPRPRWRLCCVECVSVDETCVYVGVIVGSHKNTDAVTPSVSVQAGVCVFVIIFLLVNLNLYDQNVRMDGSHDHCISFLVHGCHCSQSDVLWSQQADVKIRAKKQSTNKIVDTKYNIFPPKSWLRSTKWYWNATIVLTLTRGKPTMTKGMLMWIHICWMWRWGVSCADSLL